MLLFISSYWHLRGLNSKQVVQTQDQDKGVSVARLPNECGQALDGAPPDPRRLSAGQGKDYKLTICPHRPPSQHRADRFNTNPN